MISKPTFFLLLSALFFCANIFAQPELDTTFNGTGKTVVSGFLAGVQDVAVQPDNKIVFTGRCNTIDGPYNFCVGRLNENGSADSTFGGPRQGFVLTRITGASADSTWQSNGVAVQNDGKIVAAGSSSFGASTISIVVARYNANGALDTTFGTNGIVKTQYEANNVAGKVAVQPDGKIVLVGYNQQSDTAYRQLIVRLNSDGTLDQTFSGDGFVQINVAGNNTSGASIALQADGKILTGGAAWTISGSPNPSASTMLVRLNADGTFDTTFDEDGIKIVQGGVGAYYAGFVSIAVQSDGKILGLSTSRKLFRFEPNGAPDAGFGFAGSLDILSADTTMNDLTVTPSGKITLVGEKTYCNCAGPYVYRAARYTPNGSPDISFGGGSGYIEIDIATNTTDFGTAVAYDSTGRIILGGFSAMPSRLVVPYENGTWSFARLAAAPVQNVNFSGRVTKTDGRAVANAYLTLKNGNDVIGYARTNPFGYFHFVNIPSNVTYTLSTVSKNLNFYEQSVLIDGAIENYLIVGTN